jgi:hypothetical protein
MGKTGFRAFIWTKIRTAMTALFACCPTGFRLLVVTASLTVLCMAGIPAVTADDGSDRPGPSARRGQTTDDQRHIWNFDADTAGKLPAGFGASTVGSGPPGRWKVEVDPRSPSPPHRLIQDAPCSGSPCLHLLFFETMPYDYPDVTVRLRPVDDDAPATAGIAFAARDGQNFYAALVNLAEERLEVIRVVNGSITVLGREAARKKPTSWHSLRAQHNTNLSKDYIEVAFDGNVLFSTWDTNLSAGRIGLVTTGQGAVAFDNLFAIQLFSQRPLSPPAAY